VNAVQAIVAECRLYDRLFTEAEPEKDGRDFTTVLNPHSLEIITSKLEPSLREALPDARYQFERLGYFTLDPDTKSGKFVFNRTITLIDTWAKEQKR
jgi:glutaminyl-tRNA synthetase